MNKFVKPIGTCESTGRKYQKYLSQSDAQQAADFANAQNSSKRNYICAGAILL